MNQFGLFPNFYSLYFIFSLIIFQFNYFIETRGFVGFNGKFCAKREVDRQCCNSRDDECTVSIRVPTGRARNISDPNNNSLFIKDLELMDHKCYCDRFCKGESTDGGGNDCCPDYFSFCENNLRQEIVFYNNSKNHKIIGAISRTPVPSSLASFSASEEGI